MNGNRGGPDPPARPPDDSDEAWTPASLKDTCIVVAAFGASSVVTGLLVITMAWGIEALTR